MKFSWATLQRDSRDVLFLLAVIAWLVLPQLPYLPAWCIAGTVLVLGWRAWLALALRPLPGRWVMLVALLLAIGGTLASYRTLLGREAGVTFIVLLLALKTLELRARRDAFVVFFLGFFALLTDFFHSQSLLTALSMVVGLLGLLTALVNSHMPAGRPSLGLAARQALRMTLLGAPIMVLLFVLFPRLAPLWGSPADGIGGRSGLSARMPIGQINSLALDDTIAFRVRFDGPVPPRDQLYFRGPVFSSFDGRAWEPLQPTFAAAQRPHAELEVAGPGVPYEITLEPSNQPWLLALDATPQAPVLPGGANARMSEELVWRTTAPQGELLRYRAVAYPQFRQGPIEPMPSLQDETSLPPGYNPRTLQLGLELSRAAGGNRERIVELALERLRTGGYSYTLEPGVFGQHTADEFWFDRKQGFCEHIASAFAVLMRAADVPARIVTGYQGGERNETLGDYWVLRQSDAHAWTEVWLPGRGWVRVDPTGAVAPGRVGSTQRLLAPRGVLGEAMDRVINPTLLQGLRSTWEAINNAWNQRVLNYTQGRQLDMLRELGFSAPDWEDLGLLLAGLLVLASVAGAIWTRWEHLQHDPWLRLLDRARGQARRAGVAADGATTPRELARRLTQRLDPDHPDTRALLQWLQQFERARYAEPGAGSPASHLRALQREFRRLHWPRPAEATS